MRSALVLLALVVGCGASTPPPEEHPPPPPDDRQQEVAERPPLEPGCPARFGDPGPNCEITSLSCLYPEGQCYCGAPRRCSGVRPPDHEPREWNCIPREEPCPPVGSSCTGNAQCAPWCCGTGTVCVNGVWEQHDFPCPP